MEYGDRWTKFKIPESLVDEMKKNFIEGFQEVLITEAEKFASCLGRLVETHSNSHFTLTSMNTYYYEVLFELFSNNKMIDVKQTSIYEYEITSEKFDFDCSNIWVRDKAAEGSGFYV